MGIRNGRGPRHPVQKFTYPRSSHVPASGVTDRRSTRSYGIAEDSDGPLPSDYRRTERETRFSELPFPGARLLATGVDGCAVVHPSRSSIPGRLLRLSRRVAMKRQRPISLKV